MTDHVASIMSERTDINDPRSPTLPLAEFLERQEEDPNLFWRLQSGDHQNLLEEAIDRIEELEADRDHLAAWIVKYHSEDMLMRVRQFWLPENDAS